MTDAPTPLDLDAIRDDLDARVPARDLGDRHHARALIEEVGHLRDACKTLGGIIDRQCIDIAKIARSEHLVSDDGDADWGVIWEQAYEIADRAEKAEAEVAKLREKIDVDRAMHEAFRPEVVAEVAVLVCDEMDWQAVADWCGGTIGSTQDPSGEYTSSLTIPGVGSAGEGQWIVQRHDGTFAIRATLEGPSAESVARLTARPAPTWDEDSARCCTGDASQHDGHHKSCRYVHGDLRPDPDDRETLADAVLDLLPVRSEAVVKAEGLREAARAVENDERDGSPSVRELVGSIDRALSVEAWLRARADRLAAEGGADRG